MSFPYAPVLFHQNVTQEVSLPHMSKTRNQIAKRSFLFTEENTVEGEENN